MSKTTKENILGIDSKEDNVKHVCITKINDDYSYGKYGKFSVVIKHSNGYMNATQLCNDAGKKFKHWKCNAVSKEFIKQTMLYLNMSIDELIQPITGGQNTNIRGSYIHPLLITHVACWCGPNFSLKVSIWIEEWKKYSTHNEMEYWNAMADIKASKNLTKEKQIQTMLQKQLGGSIETKTISEKIDLLTETQLIEIKEYSNWKCAIGQLIAYSMEYPDKDKIMYLFDVPDNNIMDHIKLICKDINITVKKIKF